MVFQTCDILSEIFFSYIDITHEMFMNFFVETETDLSMATSIRYEFDLSQCLRGQKTTRLM